jgi:hypothetical protein
VAAGVVEWRQIAWRARGANILGQTRDLHGGCVRDKIKALLRAHENTEPEEKRDGYQIDDGAGDNSHGETGVAAGTFVGNSLLLGTPPEPHCSVIRMSNGNAEASRSDGMLWMAQEFVAVSLIASPGVIANCEHQRRCRDRFRNAQGREESSKAYGAPTPLARAANVIARQGAGLAPAAARINRDGRGGPANGAPILG